MAKSDRSGLSLGDTDHPVVKVVDVHKLYQYSMAVPHERVPAPIGDEPSMTRQEFSEECDVNALMARYEKTGVWPMPANGAEPRYLDLTGVPDFRQAMDLLIEAEASFMSLPATVRRDFDNDPAKFVEFAEDPKNLTKLREWGLAPPEKAPDAPMKVEVINPVSMDPPNDEPPAGGDKAKK